MKKLVNNIEELANELSNILQDYENCEVTTENVIKWANQFSKNEINIEEIIIILEELIRIFKLTYFSKKKISKVFSNVILEDFKNKEVSFLNIQQLRKSDKYKSSSQSDYIDFFKSINKTIKVNDFNADILIYFDDYLISGNSIRQDLEFLIEKKLLDKTFFYFLLVTQNGIYQIDKEEKYKNLKGKCFLTLENRLTYKNKSDVLWPYENKIKICSEYDYSKMKYRDGFEKSTLFNDNKRRKIIEDYFWKAGCFILNQTSGSALLPLGAGFPKTVGSGIISATYRNIPNNAPICLWWGDEREENYWFPLLKRNTNKRQYEEESLKDSIEWLQNIQFK